MFKIGDKVILNKDKITIHIPPITIDNEIHEILSIDRVVDTVTYVLSGYEKNYFVEDELVNIANKNYKSKNSNKQKMTLEQIEATLGFEIELIESLHNKKR